MSVQRRTGVLLIGGSGCGGGDGEKRHIRLQRKITGWRVSRRVRDISWHAALYPKRLPPINTKGTAGIRISKRAQGSTRQFRPPRQRLHGIKGSVSTRHRQRFCPIFAEAIHLTKTDPQRQRSIPLSLQAVVPKACIDIDGTHLHAMFLRITDDLRWSVEAHGRSEEHTSELQSLMRKS